MIPQLAHLPRDERRRAILAMEKDNESYPDRLQELVLDSRLAGYPNDWARPVRVLRSREFVMQVFEEADGMLRLSVNRTHVDPATLRWLDGITWDELQELKSQAGYGDREAVEIYPADTNVVNVGSLRHLWVLPAGERMPFSWQSGDASAR